MRKILYKFTLGLLGCQCAGNPQERAVNKEQELVLSNWSRERRVFVPRDVRSIILQYARPMDYKSFANPVWEQLQFRVEDEVGELTPEYMFPDKLCVLPGGRICVCLRNQLVMYDLNTKSVKLVAGNTNVRAICANPAGTELHALVETKVGHEDVIKRCVFTENANQGYSMNSSGAFLKSTVLEHMYDLRLVLLRNGHLLGYSPDGAFGERGHYWDERIFSIPPNSGLVEMEEGVLPRAMGKAELAKIERRLREEELKGRFGTMGWARHGCNSPKDLVKYEYAVAVAPGGLVFSTGLRIPVQQTSSTQNSKANKVGEVKISVHKLTEMEKTPKQRRELLFEQSFSDQYGRPDKLVYVEDRQWLLAHIQRNWRRGDKDVLLIWDVAGVVQQQQQLELKLLFVVGTGLRIREISPTLAGDMLMAVSNEQQVFMKALGCPFAGGGNATNVLVGGNCSTAPLAQSLEHKRPLESTPLRSPCFTEPALSSSNKMLLDPLGGFYHWSCLAGSSISSYGLEQEQQRCCSPSAAHLDHNGLNKFVQLPFADALTKEYAGVIDSVRSLYVKHPENIYVLLSRHRRFGYEYEYGLPDDKQPWVCGKTKKLPPPLFVYKLCEGTQQATHALPPSLPH